MNKHRKPFLPRITNKKRKLSELCILAFVVGVFIVFKVKCPLLFLFNIPCPCCGITRAYYCVLQLRFADAFNFNPMFWSVPIFLIYYVFDWQLFGKKAIDASVLSLLGAGFLVNWLIKLF